MRFPLPTDRTTPRARRAPLLLAATVGLAAAAPLAPALAQGTPAPAAGQPGADERARDLEDQVRRLEAENAGLQQKLADLQAQLDRLRGTTPETDASSMPLDPYACPATLLAELKRRYARQLGDLPRATQAQRERFDAQARHWCEHTQAEVRGRTRWLAEITDVRTPSQGPPDAVVRVLDEFTHRQMGEGVRVAVTPRTVERLATLRHDYDRVHGHDPAGESPDLAFEINALVIAAPVFNAGRTDAGVFDTPALVGTCVEFGMKLDIDSIEPVELSRHAAKPPPKGPMPAELIRPPR